MYSSKPYNSLLFLGTHNSYCDSTFDPCVQNQHLSIHDQLESGITMLDIELHADNCLEKTLIVCHGPTMVSRWLGHCTLEEILLTVKAFSDRNPQKILTLYMNQQGILDHFSWANTAIYKAFHDTELYSSVFSFNEHRKPTDPWPTVQEMLACQRPIMVFGLNGICNFKNYQNYIIVDGNVKEAWKAKTSWELHPNALWIEKQPGTQPFCLNVFASPRQFKNRPFLFGGNPETANLVNTTCVIPLHKRANVLLKGQDDSSVQCVNWIWLDFWDPSKPYALQLIEYVNKWNGVHSPCEFSRSPADQAIQHAIDRALECNNTQIEMPMTEQDLENDEKDKGCIRSESEADSDNSYINEFVVMDM